MQVAPDSVDVLDYQFKLKQRLRIFNNNDISLYNKPCNLVATASRLGLIFIGSPAGELQVIPVENLVKTEFKNIETKEYSYRSIKLPGFATHLNVNCDCTLLSIAVRSSGACNILIYKVDSFLHPNATLLKTINISSSDDIYVLEDGWNPTIPEVYTVCKIDGSLDSYEIKANGQMEMFQLPFGSGSSCFCWSPKGKQIAIGSRNGTITQYKPDLKAVKVIGTPPSMGEVLSVQWTSNYQFIGIYAKSVKQAEEQNFLVVVDAPKSGAVVYTNYDDICYSYGQNRPVQYYLFLLQQWNTLMVSSANSSEIGVLSVTNDHWTQYILPDSGRAELPLSQTTKQDTYPIGIAVDFSVKAELSMPLLLLLSHEGLLSCFAIVNDREGVAPLCVQDEAVDQRKMAGLFKMAEAVGNIIIPEKQLPIITTALPELKPINNIGVTTKINIPSNLTITPSIIQPTISHKVNQLTTIGFQANSQPNSHLLPLTKEQSAPPSPIIVQKDANFDYSQTNTQINTPKANVQARIAEMIREECLQLEAEVKAVLHRARLTQIEVITESETADILERENELRIFGDEVAETLAVQEAEVQMLKQSVIQSWAWYEDARSRLTVYTEPAMATLIRFQPLDPACERQLDEMRHLIHYLESQLIQGNRSLDEQWELFQMSCRRNAKLHMPNIEIIYQTMVKHNGTLQKQTYIMKDISTRIQSRSTNKSIPNLWVSTKRTESLEASLHNLKLDPDNLEAVKQSHVKDKLKLLTAEKLADIRSLLKSQNVNHVKVTKPNLNESMSHLNTLLAAPMSPIIATKRFEGRVYSADFIQSTPRRDVVKPVGNINAALVSNNQISRPINPRQKSALGSNINNSAFASTFKQISNEPIVSEVQFGNVAVTTQTIPTTSAQVRKPDLSAQYSPATDSVTFPKRAICSLRKEGDEPLLYLKSLTGGTGPDNIGTFKSSPKPQVEQLDSPTTTTLGSSFALKPYPADALILNRGNNVNPINSQSFDANRSDPNASFITTTSEAMISKPIQNINFASPVTDSTTNLTKSLFASNPNTLFASKVVTPPVTPNPIVTAVNTTIFNKENDGIQTSIPSTSAPTEVTTNAAKFENYSKPISTGGATSSMFSFLNTSNTVAAPIWTSATNTQATTTDIITTTTTSEKLPTQGDLLFSPPSTVMPSAATTVAATSISAFAPGTQTSIFAVPKSSNTSIFGTPTTVTDSTNPGSIFGGFGNATGENTGTGFGATQLTPTSSTSSVSSIQSTTQSVGPFGGTPFGTTTTTGVPFGGPSIFGATEPNKETGFNKLAPFGAASSPPSIFDNKPSTFGVPANVQEAPLELGSLKMAPTNSIFGGSSFGAPVNANPFGRATTAEAPTSNSNSIFGRPTNTTPSIFGGNTAQSQSSVFAQSSFSQPTFTNASIFGGTPSFEAPAFKGFATANPGMSQTGFGTPHSTFGSAPAFGSTMGSSSTFGSAPIFGGAPAFGGGSVFGSPNKVFGAAQSDTFTASTQQNSTFANLANQNTVGFGNLAQNTQTTQATGFSGGSSFSSWR